jgi:hypothetical protein
MHPLGSPAKSVWQNKEFDLNLLSRYNARLNIYALALVLVFEFRLPWPKRPREDRCFEVVAARLRFGSLARSLLVSWVYN